MGCGTLEKVQQRELLRALMKVAEDKGATPSSFGMVAAMTCTGSLDRRCFCRAIARSRKALRAPSSDRQRRLEMRYHAIAEAAPEGGWVVAVPGIRGAVTQGEDWDDAEQMARDLIATMLEVAIETVDVTLTEVGTGGIDSVVEAWHAKAGAV
jgi:predicted RNase H-like HicB family nuclease